MERLKNEPFALLGVNSDRALAKLRPRLAADGITWRSFWNGSGGTNGGIAGAFGVRGWPTIFILDGGGVIRFMRKGGGAIDQAVDELLAEQKKGSSGK
ncbi:MAG TPA: hypothetical protein VFD82_21070 [Planctomycetota bacterium]|nr:hypothetical protein [Planctomycetota bacterium]